MEASQKRGFLISNSTNNHMSSIIIKGRCVQRKKTHGLSNK